MEGLSDPSVWKATLDAYSSEGMSRLEGTPAASPTPGTSPSQPFAPSVWESALAFHEGQSGSAEESEPDVQEVPSPAKKPKPPSGTMPAWLSRGKQAQLWDDRCDPATMEADRRLECPCARGSCVGNITANGMAARRTANRITGTVEGGVEGRSQRDYCRGRLRDFLEPSDGESGRKTPHPHNPLLPSPQRADPSP